MAVRQSYAGVNVTGMYENLIYSPEHGCFNPDSASDYILELFSFSKSVYKIADISFNAVICILCHGF